MLRMLSNRRFANTDAYQFPASVLKSTFVPTVGGLADGGFVTTWMTFTGNNAAITAQRYNRSGRAVGSEITVSPAAANNGPPDATGLSSGNFVICWATPGSIQVRLYDAAGVALGVSFAANTTATPQGITSQVIDLAGGGFVVMWHQPFGTFDNIHGQVFAANGTKIGGEFTGGDATPGTKDGPDIVALANGGFVIAWDQPLVDGSALGTRAQIFDASGAKLGAAFTLNTITEGYQQSPRLAALGNGGFVAIWLDDGNGASGNPNNGNQGVWAQLFDANGHKVGENIFVDAGSDMANVAGIPGVGFAVIWKELSDSSSETYGNVRIQVFDFSGHRTGEEFAVEPHSGSIQNLPDITVLANGTMVVNWLDWRPQDQIQQPHTAVFFRTTDGTAAADTMAGTAERDFFSGMAGADQLRGAPKMTSSMAAWGVTRCSAETAMTFSWVAWARTGSRAAPGSTSFNSRPVPKRVATCCAPTGSNICRT